MNNRKPELLRLAEVYFSLHVSEEEVLRKISVGVVYQPNPSETVKPTIRASVLRWICTHNEARNFVTSCGVAIRGVIITGRLNLAFTTVNFPICLWDCQFLHPISLQLARLNLLDLKGSSIPSEKKNSFVGEPPLYVSIAAVGIHTQTTLGLNNVITYGAVILDRAVIKGGLTCLGAVFYNPSSIALSAQFSAINGGVFLCDKFTAYGEVNLASSSISGPLVFSRGALLQDSSTKTVLNANDLSVDGRVQISERFQASGILDFTQASVKGAFIILSIRESSQVGLILKFANVETLVDDINSWDIFQGLYLNGFSYQTMSSPLTSHLRLKWLRSQSAERWTSQPYRQLGSHP